MSARSIGLVLLAATALGTGCDFRGVADAAGPGPTAPVFTTIQVLPQPFVLEQTETVRLHIVALDQRGRIMDDTERLTVFSGSPRVVAAGDSGAVTGVAPGTSEITVALTVGGVTRTQTLTATVRASTPADSVHLNASDGPWTPSAAHLTVGGTVRWSVSDSINWTSVPHRRIYLLDERYRTVDSLDLRTGSATRRFPTAGTYRYCSGGCWDPPDYGAIFVR